MSAGWAKLHNALWSSAKWMRVSLAAQGMWTTAVAYSSSMRTYGRIDGHLLPLFRGTPELADELVAAGLWDVDGDGWMIHDWDDHQTSREHAEAVSAKRAAAGRKGGSARRPKSTPDHPEVAVTSDDKQFAKHPEATTSKPKQEEEEEEEEEQTPPQPPTGGEADGQLFDLPEKPKARRRTGVYDDAFEAFWAAWPKRRTDSSGKKAAAAAWAAAVHGTKTKPGRIDAPALQAAVERFAADPNLPPEQFIPNATTWLNGDRWENGPLPARGGASAGLQRGLDTVAQLRAMRDAGQLPSQQTQIRRIA